MKLHQRIQAFTATQFVAFTLLVLDVANEESSESDEVNMAAIEVLLGWEPNYDECLSMPFILMAQAIIRREAGELPPMPDILRELYQKVN